MTTSDASARIVRHDVVASTSDVAFAEIAAGRARHMDVHVARQQTRGRGRQGRGWVSAPDEGLYASFVLLPERPWNGAALTIALGLATLDAVRAVGLAHARLEWPNDVVARGSKLAGVLAETRDLDPRRPAYVAGIGVNVLQRDFPPELRAERAVTSLALEGAACTVDDVLRELVAAVPRYTRAIDADPAANERDFLRAAGLAGAPPSTSRDPVRARVVHAGGAASGMLTAFSASEGLALRSQDGSTLRLALEHVRALGPASDGECETT